MKLSSTNPNFSYIISKNPSSPAIIKSLRKGFLLAGFTDSESSYEATFIEEDGIGSSFSPNSYVTPNHTALMYTNIISELFRSCTSKRHELDTYGDSDEDNPYLCRLEIPFMPMSEDDLLIAQTRYRNKFNLIIKQWPNTSIYKLIIESERTIYETLHLAQALLFVALTRSEEYLNYSTKGFLDKYTESCKIVGLPYRFISRINNTFLVKRDLYQSHKGLEEAFNKLFNNEMTLSLERGNTQDSRKRWIETQVDETLPLVDLGCGSGSYLFLAKRVPKYIPIDKDEWSRKRVELKIEDKHLENVEGPYSSIQDYLEQNPKPTQYLITEVLEHMSFDEAKELIKTCVQQGKARKLIITFPNHAFNEFYNCNNKDVYRHPDHHWEGTIDIVNELVIYAKSIDCNSCSVEQIGDRITYQSGYSICPTYALVIKCNQ